MWRFWPLHPRLHQYTGTHPIASARQRSPCPWGTCGERANGSELQASGCTSWSIRGTYTVRFTSRCSKSREHVCKVVVCVCRPLGGGPRAPWGHWAGCRGWSLRPGMRLCPELGSQKSREPQASAWTLTGPFLPKCLLGPWSQAASQSHILSLGSVHLPASPSSKDSTRGHTFAGPPRPGRRRLPALSQACLGIQVRVDSAGGP